MFKRSFFMDERIRNLIGERLHVELSQHASKLRQQSDLYISSLRAKKAAQGMVFNPKIANREILNLQIANLKESVSIIFNEFKKVLEASKTTLDDETIKQLKELARLFYKTYYDQ